MRTSAAHAAAVAIAHAHTNHAFDTCPVNGTVHQDSDVIV
jgi:hypothetical protein